MKLFMALAAAIFFFPTFGATAFDKQDGQTCADYGKEANQRILACSRILTDPNISQKIRALAHIKRGEAYIMSKDSEHALPEYEEGIRLDPTNWEGYNGRGTLLSKRDQRDRALADYNKATELNPKHPWPWINRCEDLTIWDRFEEALDQCNKMIQIRAGEGPGTGVYARGILYLKWKKLDLALADFNETLRHNPKNATALYGRGLAKRKKGDTAGAAADMDAANKLYPTVAKYYERYKIN